jgi:ribosomal protein S18 acetylase RimI-like enzyme
VSTSHEPPHFDLLSITDTPDPRDLQRLEDRIDAFNMELTGITDVRLLAIVLRDARGEIVAGLHGWTWGGCCEVKTLWIDEPLRGRGLGTRLMRSAETEARRRGATQMVLSTHSFQAPAFYRRLGFEVVGQVEDYPVGYRSLHLRKSLRPDRRDP